MKPVLLSVVLDNDGTNYVTSQKKPKLFCFNADDIVEIKNISTASALNGSSSIILSNPNWAASRRYNIAENVAQFTTCIDNSSANAFADTSLAITAHAGGGQSSAVALTAYWNKLTTVATAADSVKLPDATTATSPVVVQNAGAAAAAVFPITGQKIDSGAANASSSVAVGKTVIFASNGTQWYTIS